jgi:hypothetical protein
MLLVKEAVLFASKVAIKNRNYFLSYIIQLAKDKFHGNI